MATTADFKNGLVLVIDGQLWTITEFQHVKPGKGPAFVRTKLKNVLSGKVVDKTFNAGVKVDTATVDRRDTTYLYRDGSDFVFMDSQDYEQHPLPEALVGDAARFLLEGMPVQVAFHNGVPLYIELPVTVELEVTHTEPGLQGDRSSAGTKPATLQTGAQIGCAASRLCTCPPHCWAWSMRPSAARPASTPTPARTWSGRFISRWRSWWTWRRCKPCHATK